MIGCHDRRGRRLTALARGDETMKPFFMLCGVLAIGFVLAAGATAHEEPARNLTVWAAPGARFTFLSDINDRGDIVGSFEPSVSSEPSGRSLLLSGGRFFTFVYPGADNTDAVAINNRGDIVGGYYGSDNVAGGFVFRKGTFTALDCSGSGASPHDINNKGDIVGIYSGADGRSRGFLLRASGVCETFEYPAADVGFTDASAINDRGDIAGTYGTFDGVHGFTLRDGKFATIDYPSGTFTRIFGLNDRGDLIGPYIGLGGRDHGFLFDASTGLFMTLDGPTGDSLSPYGINDRGDIVGIYSRAGERNGYSSFILKGFYRSERKNRIGDKP